MSTKTFKTLYSQKSTKKVLKWDINVSGTTNNATITTIYGQIDGKMIENKRVIDTGKNIGKKNETTPFEQAVFEATKLWQKKIDQSGYIEFLDIQNDNLSKSDKKQSSTKEQKLELNMIRPMLAHKYDDKKKHIKYPCFVQPKLDGVRCLAYKDNGIIYLMSRTGKPFIHLNHIKEALEKIDFTGFLDGELFTTKMEFSNISGIIRKQKLNKEDIQLSYNIEYHVYDTFDINNLEIPFNERNQIVNNFKLKKYLQYVPTYLCKTEEIMLSKYDDFVKKGFEGIMIRNYDGLYKVKFRSNDLIKLKPFLDAEYKIVDFTQGTGRDKGCVIWICENNNGETFRCRPNGSLDERKELFNNGKKYIGKMLTIRYQELQDDIPRFGIGIGIRDYE